MKRPILTILLFCILLLSACNFNSNNGETISKINSIQLTPGNIYRYCEINLETDLSGYDLKWQGIGATEAKYTINVKAATTKYYFYNAIITVKITVDYTIEKGNIFKSQKENKTKSENKEIYLSMGGNGSISGIINLDGLCKDGGTTKVDIISVAGFIKET